MPDETMDIGRVFGILIDGIYKRDDTIAVLRSRIAKLQEELEILQEKLEAWREHDRHPCKQTIDNLRELRELKEIE